MQMSAQKQWYIPGFQKIYKLFAMLNRAFIHIDFALIQQIVIGNRDNFHPRIPGSFQLLLHPLIGCLRDRSAHLVHRTILAAVNHQKPGIFIQFIQIA